jgi:hypothetical protein
VLGPGGSTLVTVTVQIAEDPGTATDTTLLSARCDLDGGTRGYALMTTKRRLLGDLNSDDVVDAADFANFCVCLTGPGIEVAGGCAGADLDFDRDADLADFAALQLRFGVSD